MLSGVYDVLFESFGFEGFGFSGSGLVGFRIFLGFRVVGLGVEG